MTPDLLGLNAVNTTGPRWDDGGLDAVLSKFGPGMLRYPGGTNANYWDWRKGWFQPGRWPAEKPKPVDDKIGVFKTGLTAAGSAPLFVLNVLTYQGAVGSAALNGAMLRGQTAFLRAAAAAGMPVTKVELGNELYLNGAVNHGPHGRDYANRFPTAADYASQMNTWIAALHKDFPGVQVAAVAADPNSSPECRSAARPGTPMCCLPCTGRTWSRCTRSSGSTSRARPRPCWHSHTSGTRRSSPSSSS